jgi:energy-coupling factor transport system ATP-binding protein
MIDLSNVRFSYDGEAYALDGITAHISPGEFVCILGGNGSGKSTLAKHMNALLLPDEGTVTVDGMSTADQDCTYLIRQTAGMVFQNPDDQLVASLVEDDVAFGPENLGVATDELRERVTKALADVGLSGFERHETHALSGGQKQRVAIAGVLAMNPRVLILDEASAMLDPRGRAGLMRVCRDLHERGFTIVMITHFMEEAAQADRVIVLERGKVACEGTPSQVLTQTQLLDRLNLDVPFAARLSRDLREAGVEVSLQVDADDLADEVLDAWRTKRGVRASSAGVGGAVDTAVNPDGADGSGSVNVADREQGDSLDAQADEAVGEGAGANIGADAGGDALPAALASEPDNLPGEPLIRLINVSYTYDAARAKRRRKAAPGARKADWGNAPDEVWALRDVTFSVRKGEFLGIAGHTGSGKSTLIQHMNGILKPVSGTVLVKGADVSQKKNEAALRGTVGVVFQYPEQQLFAETVAKDVAFGPRNLGLSEEDVDRRVREAMARVGLPYDEFAERSPFALSGGQQRRAAFAGVLAMEPSVLVLDEPAAGLDPASRTSFLAMVKRLHEQGLTVVMVSHDMDDLAAMCDRVAIMNQGRLMAIGAPDQLFVHERALRNVGLGTTSAQSFATRLATGGAPVRRGLLHDMDSLVRLIDGMLR